eukprot:symbB.v1.2.005593.t1/scaffold326.1/size228935/15
MVDIDRRRAQRVWLGYRCFGSGNNAWSCFAGPCKSWIFTFWIWCHLAEHCWAAGSCACGPVAALWKSSGLCLVLGGAGHQPAHRSACEMVQWCPFQVHQLPDHV